MTELYGRHPALTDDIKHIVTPGQLPRHLNTSFNNNNGFSSEMKFINSSGWDLLILTADGLRLHSPVGSGKSDGNCYFMVRYKLGGYVDLDVSWRAENEPLVRQQLEEIERLVSAYRQDPLTGRPTYQEAVIDFHYRVECIELDHYKHGVWIPVLGIHLFLSNGRDALCKHYGRSMYTEVIAFNNDFANQEEVSQATGCGVVYFVSNPTEKDPIIISNRHFSGVVLPTYDPGQKPGVHIYNVGQRNDTTNKQLTDIVFIPVIEFAKNGIYRSKEELEAALDNFARNMKNQKDTVEYKELLENIRQTFPEFYKRYEVPRKPFDLTTFMTDVVAGIAAASKVKSVIGG
ncbi:hypothetical protein ST201phi2-1p202 [Pseudomonas phage 201phi2-1]|uniref:Uncharacterized protein n=1 Tax=Pseudomonas phage 201phi2-1 TaxID=198110 RepID=B3FJ64_BP201|nr:hypothetical protein ST201phi2-1p202 [Pseudomonas phage 201phi2-1]ABY63031.1 hypothetical protein 201phi2-1p202 [Pseudomonas phage 201phi2-1]